MAVAVGVVAFSLADIGVEGAGAPLAAAESGSGEVPEEAVELAEAGVSGGGGRADAPTDAGEGCPGTTEVAAEVAVEEEEEEEVIRPPGLPGLTPSPGPEEEALFLKSPLLLLTVLSSSVVEVVKKKEVVVA